MRIVLFLLCLITSPGLITSAAFAQEGVDLDEVQPFEAIETPAPAVSPDAVAPDAAATEASAADNAASETVEVSDAVLASFVKSLLAIQPLLSEASEALLATESDDERRQIEAQFEERAIAIIGENEISVDDYRRLITLANSDAAFTERVANAIDQQQASPEAEATPEEALPE